jgi:transketolase
MRNTFINTLVEQAKTCSDMFLLCGDLGFSVLEPFAEQFPDRFLNVGIAEQNMATIATGLAIEGYNVFTYSIGNFPTLRCMEQIRLDICYRNANVKTIAVGAGYAYGPLGVSHHTTEDIAMLRSIPNLLVTAPAALATFMSKYKGPAYVRINKSGEPKLHAGPVSVSPGQFIKVREGKGTLVMGTGAIVEEIAREIDHHKLPFSLISTPFIGAIDQDQLVTLAINFREIITVEEHQLNGGFGSSILEQFSDLYSSGIIPTMPKVHRIGIPNQFIGYAGSQGFLRQAAGLNLSRFHHHSSR